MYFPYLRGRQYELIALRDLLDNNRLSKNVIPIIEPVKLTSTLINTLEKFKTTNTSCALILNPAVGSFSKEYSSEEKVDLVNRLNSVLDNNESLYYTSLINDGYQPIDNFYQNDMGDNRIIICKKPDDLQIYNKLYTSSDITYNLISDNSRLRRGILENRVKLGDNFSKLPRNIDYAKISDEFYSDDHIVYQDDGYIGFSDYSVVGDNYAEAGFAPYAVAIHIVYFDKEDNLRIRHFVSDSNLDPSNPAGKFKEALSKMMDEVNNKTIDRTLAVEEFEKLFNLKSYPGLGTVKKLSIMHHIELVGKYLDR